MNATNISIVLNKTLQYDTVAFHQLEQLANMFPGVVVGSIKEFLQSDENSDLGDVLIGILVNIQGMRQVEEWILNVWSSLSHAARRKIVYPWLYGPNGMPTQLAIKLFEDSANGVEDRHLLAAGLSVSMFERNTQVYVRQMIERLGSYDDPIRQESLESYLLKVRTNLGADMG